MVKAPKITQLCGQGNDNSYNYTIILELPQFLGFDFYSGDGRAGGREYAKKKIIIDFLKERAPRACRNYFLEVPEDLKD